MDLLASLFSATTVIGSGFPVRAILIAIVTIAAICFFVWFLGYWLIDQFPVPAGPMAILVRVLRVIIVVLGVFWVVIILLGLVGVSFG